MTETSGTRGWPPPLQPWLGVIGGWTVILSRRACASGSSAEAPDVLESRQGNREGTGWCQEIPIERQHELAHPVRLSAGAPRALPGPHPALP